MSKKTEGKSLTQQAWEQLRKNNVALISAALILILCVIAVLAPWISPYPFDEQFLDKVLVAPNPEFWLGTDSLGRDMLSRLIYGARVSMAVEDIAVLPCSTHPAPRRERKAIRRDAARIQARSAQIATIFS